MKWTIVYDDLKVVTGKGEEQFKLAPTDGVQFVVWSNGQIFFDHNYYWYINEVIDQTNDLGPLVRKLGIKHGRTTTNENFEAARALAIKAMKEYVS